MQLAISQRIPWKLTWVLVPCLLLAGASGCSRTFWRDQADRDSYLALTEKLTDPRWQLPRIDVTADPRSRFFDPYDPDAEPLPPDDPAAHVYMHWVDGWSGYKGWHKFGDVMSVENPQWLANFGLSTDNLDPLTGEIVSPVPQLTNVTLQESVELAQIHKREYQFEIENVYLAALAVTFQRFQFGVRYLGSSGVEPTVDTQTTFVPHGAGDNSVLGVAGGVSQLLPAGTQWAVEFANNTIWLFGGGSQTSSLSDLSFSIVQPLLFGAGRKVGLEGLTQAERNLLYEARILARLRKEIFVEVVGNGFLPLLQQVQTIRNQEGNLKRLEEQVERLLAQSARNELFANAELAEWPADAPPSDQLLQLLPVPIRDNLRYDVVLGRLSWAAETPITDEEIELLRNISADPVFDMAVESLITTLRTRVATLDVLNLQSSLASSINDLRDSERALQDSFDNFKFSLGLPPDMKFSIDDRLLEQFEFIDEQLIELEEVGKDFVKRWGQLNSNELDIDNLRMVYANFLKLVDEVEGRGLDTVIEDMQRLDAALPRRLETVPEEAQEQLRTDVSRAKTLLAGAEKEMDRIRQEVVKNAQSLQKRNAEPEERLENYEQLNVLREDLVRLTQNLTVIQVSIRVELIEVQPFDIAMRDAVETGVNNRLDLMNARAQVMDARRKVEIAANALLATLDFVAEADFANPPGNKPFDFRGNQSRIRAGLAFTAPLDQINERNNYRTTLINYQRARRDYMEAEDNVKRNIRRAWRQLYVLRQNIETSRRAVRIAALRYDSAVEDSNAPVSEQQIRSAGNGVAGTNLVNALQNILNAQNQLIRNWTSYEQNRLNIYRDMGIMEIGEDGLWDDPFYRSQPHDDTTTPTGKPLDMGADLRGNRHAGGSGLGGGTAETGMARLPDGDIELPPSPEEFDSGDGQTRAVPRQPERAGVPR